MASADVEPIMADITAQTLSNGVLLVDEIMKEVENDADDETMRRLEAEICEVVCHNLSSILLLLIFFQKAARAPTEAEVMHEAIIHDEVCVNLHSSLIVAEILARLSMLLKRRGTTELVLDKTRTQDTANGTLEQTPTQSRPSTQTNI
jgi:hypothetical protein